VDVLNKEAVEGLRQKYTGIDEVHLAKKYHKEKGSIIELVCSFQLGQLVAYQSLPKFINRQIVSPKAV